MTLGKITSLFSGAGGVGLFFSRARLPLACTVDSSTWASATHPRNFQNTGSVHNAEARSDSFDRASPAFSNARSKTNENSWYPNVWPAMPDSKYPVNANDAQTFRHLFWRAPGLMAAIGQRELHFRAEGRKRLGLCEATQPRNFSNDIVLSLHDEHVTNSGPPPMARNSAGARASLLPSYSQSGEQGEFVA